jgi:hypothetical protein
MRKYLTIYEEALVIYDFATAPFWISLYLRENFVFFFIRVRFRKYKKNKKKKINRWKKTLLVFARIELK